jgi:hypothetical protein
MKIYKIFRIIIPVFFLHLWACQQEEDIINDIIHDEDMVETEVENYLFDAEEMNVSINDRIADITQPCTELSLEMPLISWPGTEAGIFRVNNNMEYLIASFELDPEGIWDLKHTQLLIEVQEIKENPKKTIVKTKKFLYPVHHENGTRTFTYMVPLSDLKLTNDQTNKCISVAGIARLYNQSYTRTKFAIGQYNMGKRISRKTWLHEYCLSDCSTTETGFVSGTAWMEGISYTYNDNKTGYYEIFISEMSNKYVDLFVIDDVSGDKTKLGEVEILFWGASSAYDLFIEFQPIKGYDILDAQIYVGILDPIRGPETFKNPVKFTDQHTLVFKKRIDFTPVYVAIAATVCIESINL